MEYRQRRQSGEWRGGRTRRSSRRAPRPISARYGRRNAATRPRTTIVCASISAIRSLVVAQQSQFDTDIQRLAELRNVSNNVTDDRIRSFQAIVPDLSNDEARQLLLLDSSRWNSVTAAARRLLETTMSQTIPIEQLAQIKENLRDRVDSNLLTSDQQSRRRPYPRLRQGEPDRRYRGNGATARTGAGGGEADLGHRSGGADDRARW